MLRHKANLAASTPRLPPAGMEIAAYGDSQAVRPRSGLESKVGLGSRYYASRSRAGILRSLVPAIYSVFPFRQQRVHRIRSRASALLH